MQLTPSKVHSYIDPRKIKAIESFDSKNYRALSKIGIHLRDEKLREIMDARQGARRGFGMDAIQPTVTTGSIAVPVQFLQSWLPGWVKVITAARKSDDLMGIQTIGAWEDEQVVQGVLEMTGSSQPYGDYTNVPQSSWNVNFVYRTVVRFEEGLQVSDLEEARAARINIDTAGSKREAAADALEIQRNFVAFYGFNAGDNLTYGFLNDPGLPSYVTVPNGVSGHTFWSTKTFLEICADIRTMISTLRSQSQDQIDPEKLEMTLALATNVVDYLSVTSDFGISVRGWLSATYPKIQVISAPELNAADGGLNVGYLYAERVNDLSTDGGRVWIQPVPAKFMVLGVEKLAKGFIEDYSNATAGAMLKRPWAVTRVAGL